MHQAWRGVTATRIVAMRERTAGKTNSCQFPLSQAFTLGQLPPIQRQMVHCHSHLQFTGFQNNEARKYEVISNLWPHRLNICANLWSWHSVGRQHLNTNKVSGTHLVFRLDCFFVAKEVRMVVQRLCHSSQLLHKGHLINVYTCLTNTVRTTTTEEVRDNITWPMCVCAVFTLKQGHLKAYCNRTFIWLNL